jgi:hypothetical protein
MHTGTATVQHAQGQLPGSPSSLSCTVQHGAWTLIAMRLCRGH